MIQGGEKSKSNAKLREGKKKLLNAKRSQKPRQESARMARFLFQAQHFSVCTDLAAASTAAAAATMGSFTYK